MQGLVDAVDIAVVGIMAISYETFCIVLEEIMLIVFLT